jgi:Kef-type K+ transport system membrane component KefB
VREHGQVDYGGKQFNNNVCRLFKHTAPTHAMYGGSLFLGYQLVFELLRHHDETNQRPMFIDHTIAMIALGMGAAIAVGGGPKQMIVGAIFSGLTLSPMSYWLKV